MALLLATGNRTIQLSEGEAEIDVALAPNDVDVDCRSASVSAPPDRMPSNEAENM